MVIGIIEDDNLLRKALDTSLQNQGYTVVDLINYQNTDLLACL